MNGCFLAQGYVVCVPQLTMMLLCWILFWLPFLVRSQPRPLTSIPVCTDTEPVSVNLLQRSPALAHRPARPHVGADDTLVLLASDNKMIDKCLATAQTVRSGGMYQGAVAYVLDDVASLDKLQIASFNSLNVEVLSLEHVLHSADPLGNSAHLAKLTPPPCNFDRDCPNAARRLRGWRGYYVKTLATMTSYWTTRYSRALWMDCGMVVSSPPLADMFSEIDVRGRLLARSDYLSFPIVRNTTLATQFHPPCETSLFDALVDEYRQYLLRKDYFTTTTMLYDTALLGFRNEVLKDVVMLYRKWSLIADSDQAALNLYWGPSGRNLWVQLPVRRDDIHGPDCFYDYENRTNTKEGCSSYVMNKLLISPEADAYVNQGPWVQDAYLEAEMCISEGALSIR